MNNNSISLYGFNSLTKSLSFSLYKLTYLHTLKQLAPYQAAINSQYSSDKLTKLLSDICHAIGGNILNIASQNYQPHGASVTLMISEEAAPEPLPQMRTESNAKNKESALPSSIPLSLVAHLDKSHLCIHTYPEEAPSNNIAIFRIIDTINIKIDTTFEI